jgi:hypothetical protein
MHLFQFSTCFEQPRAHHQENQLYQYNICYVSLCVGDCLVCRSGSSFPSQLDPQFLFFFVYFNSLHVSSNPVLIIRRINCINIISGICHSENKCSLKLPKVCLKMLYCQAVMKPGKTVI